MNEIFASLRDVRPTLLNRLLSQSLLPQSHTPLSTPVPYICIILTSGAFMLMATLLWMFGGYHAAFHTLNDLGALLPDTLWSAMTLLGDTQVAFAVLLFVLFRFPQLLPATLIAAIPATLISHGLKHATDLDRPAAVLPPESYHLIGSMIKHGSFPSGHSTTAGVIAALFIVIARSRAQRSLAITAFALVTVSRVMVGAHWPIDVLVGGAIGLICGLAGYELATQYRCCRTAKSQWLAMLLPFYAVLAMPFHDGGYPLGHGLILLLVLIGALQYLKQLQRPASGASVSNAFGF
ncbi:hypothetical protein ADIMK_3595 [Marinobacterium lacunae]|uniref:undecaprenyl-diphosphate phosphatase n=1 Tax=Marinobacterium lacunae TaxID=1232683 RepID=A0A081FUV0_9GAMM|nr:phosphatase PAP2 family protein [Marinobacterium lacunae]KEA62305.1 hypothetical protein ADIMK_3595 [Marinobacterium lacunae]MBR9884751.1 phosphatase PAP2 family protein [Oceanospirillales bacterium]